MRIGIDISQLAYEGTGVATSVEKLVDALTSLDKKNSYVLFAGALRQKHIFKKLENKYKDKKNVSFVVVPFPPSLLELLWNRLRLFPVEVFVGKLDVFISSDWTEPPVKNARKITFIHDLIVFKFPNETHSKIIETQKRKLSIAIKECKAFICPSLSTKNDMIEILGIPEKKISVIAWGA